MERRVFAFSLCYDNTGHGRSSHLQVGHGDAVHHVVAGLLNGTEQVVERSNVDAWFLVCSQHGVRLPTTWKRGQNTNL